MEPLEWQRSKHLHIYAGRGAKLSLAFSFDPPTYIYVARCHREWQDARRGRLQWEIPVDIELVLEPAYLRDESRHQFLIVTYNTEAGFLEHGGLRIIVDCKDMLGPTNAS